MIETIIYSFITSLGITFLAIPTLIKIAKAKNLYDEPEERKSHKEPIPTLGGVAIFSGLIFAITFWTKFTLYPELQYIIAALAIVSLLGIKDDISGLSPFKKLMGQVFAAFVLTIWGDIRISSMFGIFGIGELPEIISVLFSVFTILVIINSLNLIDGINGLSGTTGIIAATTFGIWFFLVDPDSQLAIVAFSLIGALAAFLRFNVSPAKIFMGDTGSMSLGLILAVFAIEFIEMNNHYSGPFAIKSAPIIAMAIILFPLFDLLRSFSIRIAKGKSPFRPDRNHIHHMLIDLGLTHSFATFIINMFSISMIILALLLRDIGNYLLGGLLIALSLSFVGLLYFLLRRKNLKE